MSICKGCGKDAGVMKNGKKRLWHNECYREFYRKDMGNLFLKKSKYNRKRR